MKKLLLSLLLLIPSLALSIVNPLFTPSPMTNYPTPLPGAQIQSSFLAPIMNWPKLCPEGQALDTNLGCMPDCNRQETIALCANIFQTGQVEQRTGIQPPYNSGGIIVFSLPQIKIAKTAKFNLLLRNSRAGYGYICELLNADATPAYLWDTLTQTYANVILMDNNSAANGNKSDNFVKIAVQGVDEGGYWISDSNNPLYLMCLSYAFTSNSMIQSTAGCSGTGSGCISYTLQ